MAGINGSTGGGAVDSGGGDTQAEQAALFQQQFEEALAVTLAFDIVGDAAQADAIAEAAAEEEKISDGTADS